VILDEILDHKRGELARARARVAPEELARRAREVVEPTRGFRHTLMSAPAPRIVAEVKRRSPSKGLIRQDFDPVDCAVAYAQGGAAALSVLTDEHFFGGHLDHLEKVRRAVELPLLRKDFAIDPYQIDEARVAGADAVLLIASALAPDQIETLRRHALSLGLDVLVEVHDEAQLEVALASGADLVGINNRNLHTFETDLGVTERLAPRVPSGVVLVAESGIFTPSDVARLTAVGAHAFLVGESLMRQSDIGTALRRLRRTP
jgi:indole-3-glycerol phosphate synthase